MTDFVALFPGQGSQSIGMMQNLTSNLLIKKTFEEASDILNTNFWDMVNIENTDINQTINIFAKNPKCSTFAKSTGDLIAVPRGIF